MISNFTDQYEIKPDTDIYNDLRCVGDDFFELLEMYSKHFSVDMSAFLWYFHSDGEGPPGIGQEFFKPPYDRVERIPVTPAMLTEFANSGKWSIEYPPHQIPKIRWDIRIDLILVVCIAMGIVVYLLLK